MRARPVARVRHSLQAQALQPCGPARVRLCQQSQAMLRRGSARARHSLQAQARQPCGRCSRLPTAHGSFVSAGRLGADRRPLGRREPAGRWGAILYPLDRRTLCSLTFADRLGANRFPLGRRLPAGR